MKQKNKKKDKTVCKILGSDPKKKKILRKSKVQRECPTSSTEFSSNWKAFQEKQKSLPLQIRRKEKPQNESKKMQPKRKKKPKENDVCKSKDSIWFDVDPLLLEQECGVSTSTINVESTKVRNNSDNPPKTPKLIDETVENDPKKITKYIAIDCEMVGIGFEGKENALARVSLVNSNCECIYDKFVKPSEKVIDYRTFVSGVRPSDLRNAPSYEVVQKEVSEMLNGRVLVGHALQNDLKCLMLGHSRKQIRDTSKYKPFHKLLGTNRPALRKLVAKILQEEIQTGEHSSVIDARATMKIFKLYRREWEKSLHGGKRISDIKEIYMGNDRKQQRKNKWKNIRIMKKRKMEEQG